MTDVSQPTPTPPTEPTTQPVTPEKTEPGAQSLLNQAIDKAPTTMESKTDGGETKTDAKPDAGAPAKYADFKLPEGVTLPAEALTKATTLMRESGLSQEQAQKFVDFHTAALREAFDGPAKLWQDTQDAWVDELRSDPAIGKGIENGTVGASIAKMISTLPAPQATAFREAMNFTGAGNNPAIVRAFYELSKRFAEPGHVQGNAPAQVKTRPTAAQALFPSLAPKE